MIRTMRRTRDGQPMLQGTDRIGDAQSRSEEAFDPYVKSRADRDFDGDDDKEDDARQTNVGGAMGGATRRHGERRR